MSSYTRQPARTVAHCPYCKWIRIYFADFRKRLDHKMRAWIGLNVHTHRAHRKAGTE